MHEVLVNRLGGLKVSLPRKSVARLTDRPDMTLDVYRGRKTTMQQCNSVGALVNNKPTSCKQLLYYDFVSTLCSTDDLPRKSEAHCYTERHTKIMP